MKSIFILLSIILFPMFSYSQSDTLWFDMYDQYATPKTADYYRFRGGSLVVDDKLITDRNFYYTNGNLMKEVKRNINGSKTSKWKLSFRYYNPEGESRLVSINTGDFYVGRVQYSYFDSKGKLLSKAYFNRIEGAFIEGTMVEFYKDDLLKVKSIITKNNNVEVERKDFYKNGELAHVFKVEDVKSKEGISVYYNTEGKKISEFLWSIDGVEKNGKLILQDPKDFNVLGYKIYNKEQLEETRMYQQKGSNFPGQYMFTRNDTFFIYSYINNILTDTLSVVNSRLVNGVGYEEDGNVFKKTTFLESETVEKIEYYTKELKQVKIHVKGLKTVYYDEDNKILGSLISSETKRANRTKPMDGSLFAWNTETNLLEKEFRYEQGELREELFFDYHPITNKRFNKSIKRYDKPYVWGNYTETVYFLSGNIKSITTRNKNRLSHQVFYNQNEEELPTTSDIEGEKITYDYFNIPDQEFVSFRRIDYKNNIISKTRWYSPNSEDKSQKDLQVKEEYKRDGLNMTFTREGTILSQGERVNGKTVNGSEFEFTVSYVDNEANGVFKTYKEGKLNGEFKRIGNTGKVMEIKYYKNGKQHGEAKSFYKNEKLQYKSQYVDGKMEGIAVSYDMKGVELSQNTYKDGKMYNGEIQDYKTGLIQVYKEGFQVSSKFPQSNKEYIRQEKISENKLFVTIFYRENEGKFCEYYLVDNELDGPIKYYSSKGKILYSGVFEKGVLISGDLFYGIIDNTQNFNLVHLKCKGDLYTITYYDRELNEIEGSSSKKIQDILYAMLLRSSKSGRTVENESIESSLRSASGVQMILSDKKNRKKISSK